MITYTNPHTALSENCLFSVKSEKTLLDAVSHCDLELTRGSLVSNIQRAVLTVFCRTGAVFIEQHLQMFK